MDNGDVTIRSRSQVVARLLGATLALQDALFSFATLNV